MVQHGAAEAVPHKEPLTRQCDRSFTDSEKPAVSRLIARN